MLIEKIKVTSLTDQSTEVLDTNSAIEKFLPKDIHAGMKDLLLGPVPSNRLLSCVINGHRFEMIYSS